MAAAGFGNHKGVTGVLVLPAVAQQEGMGAQLCAMLNRPGRSSRGPETSESQASEPSPVLLLALPSRNAGPVWLLF